MLEYWELSARKQGDVAGGDCVLPEPRSFTDHEHQALQILGFSGPYTLTGVTIRQLEAVGRRFKLGGFSNAWETICQVESAKIESYINPDRSLKAGDLEQQLRSIDALRAVKVVWPNLADLCEIGYLHRDRTGYDLFRGRRVSTRNMIGGALPVTVGGFVKDGLRVTAHRPDPLVMKGAAMLNLVVPTGNIL